MAEQDKDAKDPDLFRDTPVRLLGYANEVGEAFRSLVPGWAVGLSYAVATGYVFSDTAHKAHKAHNEPWESAEARRREVTLRAVDTVLWQGLASVAVPGLAINRLCWLSAALLKRQGRLPPTVQKWSTTALGLAAIPFIIHPIDTGVHVAMDASIRPFLGVSVHYTTE